MKNFLNFFGKWWMPILFYVLINIPFVIGIILKNAITNDFIVIIFLFSLLLLLFSTIILFFKGKCWKGLLNFLFFCIAVVSMLYYVIILGLAGPYFDGTDRFADNLTIPDNIQIENPLKLRENINLEEFRPDSATNKQQEEVDFQLYSSYQPGLYEYDFWTGKIESGTIYLKAFEITQEYALSRSRLPKASSVKIFNPTDSIKRFGTTSHFTIYEGDFGKPYAARFEVWFKPDNGGPERKLLSKNYKIEGWMF